MPVQSLHAHPSLSDVLWLLVAREAVGRPASTSDVADTLGVTWTSARTGLEAMTDLGWCEPTTLDRDPRRRYVVTSHGRDVLRAELGGARLTLGTSPPVALA